MNTSNRYLFLFDFDGTLADTFSPSPHNIGVSEAYEQAVEIIFGENGLQVYKEIGGLQNNAPSELIKRMLEYDASLGGVAQTRFLSAEYNLVWDEDNPAKTITELLIQEKIRILTGEIGSDWPKPFDGVIDMFERIHQLHEDGIPIEIGVVTSGHTEFVKKVLDTWGVQDFHISITDDDLRYKYPMYPKQEADRLVKPSSTLFAIARSKWLRAHGIEPVTIDFDFVLGMQERVIYFGDDTIKDGEFAKNSKILFGHFTNGGEDSVLQGESFDFASWEKLQENLLSNEAVRAMQEGKSMQEILSLTQIEGREHVEHRMPKMR